MAKWSRQAQLAVMLLVLVLVSLLQHLHIEIITQRAEAANTVSIPVFCQDGETSKPKSNVVKRDYPKVRLYTLANEVVALMTSMISGTSPYGHPLPQRLLPHRALVFMAPEDRVHEVYSLIFAARTLGDWNQDIVVLGERFTSLEKEAFSCLDVRFVDFARNRGAEAFRKKLSGNARLNTLNKLLFAHLQEFREYDILQFLDLDSVIVGPIKKIVQEDFDVGEAILFEEKQDMQSCFDKIPTETVNSKKKQKDSPTCISTSSFAIFTWNLPRNDKNQILNEIENAAKYADSQKMLSNETAEWEAYAMVNLLKKQWRSKWLGGVAQSSLPDPLGFESEQARQFSFIYTNGTYGRPSVCHSPYHTRYVFTTFLAGSFLRCHSSISSIIDPSNDKFELDAKTLSAVKRISLDYINWMYHKKLQGTFKERYRNIGNDTKQFPARDHIPQPNRVLVFWASKGYVEGAYAVAFQARTIGQWHQDMVLLTDEITDINKAALECLKVKVVFYNPADFRKRFPWVAHNHWYYKLLPFLLPEFREYDIVQYFDLDVIVTGPLRQHSYSDFAPGVHVLMDDAGHDTSILERESILPKLSAEEKKTFVKRFPGADRQQNGPNLSPSGSASFDSFLVSKIEPIDELYNMFSNVAKDYYKVLTYGDQPLIMLTFWGRWRMKYANKVWRSPLEHIFDGSQRHRTTHGVVRYVHTGGGMRPALPTSPYKPIEVFTNILAADLLDCQAIIVEAVSAS